VLHTAPAPSGPRPVIAPDRDASVCMTSFGTPVVPEVNRIHSVRSLARRISVRRGDPGGAGDKAASGADAAIGDDDIGLGGGDHRRQMLVGTSGGHSTIRRAIAVELDQRQGCGQLVAYLEQHRDAAQLVERSAEARIPRQGGQLDAGFSAVQPAVAKWPRLRSASPRARSAHAGTSPTLPLVELDEVATVTGNAISSLALNGSEAETVFEAARRRSRNTANSRPDSKQPQTVRQRRQLTLLFGRDLLEG